MVLQVLNSMRVITANPTRPHGSMCLDRDVAPRGLPDAIIQMFEEAIFRFAALTVVLICYPHIKFDEVTTPSGTYPDQLSQDDYDLIGEVVRVGVSEPNW